MMDRRENGFGRMATAFCFALNVLMFARTDQPVPVRISAPNDGPDVPSPRLIGGGEAAAAG